MKKKIFISSVVMTGILAIGALGVLPASAQNSAGYPPIVERIAEHFGLNQDEVADVFEEVHAEHEAVMLSSFEDRLNDAVSEGKITEEQKQAILDKHEEIQAKMAELKDLTPEERREQVQSLHEELRTWAESQGIDFPFMAFKAGFRHGMKAGMFFDKLD